MSFVTVNQSKLFYRFDGHSNGDCVVLIHGVGADHELWRGIIEELGSIYRILSLDLRGHGLSCKKPCDYSIASFTNDVLRVLNHSGIEKCHLVGFSLGGLIAQQFALENSSRLCSLITISSVAGRTKAEQQTVKERAKLLETNGALVHLSQAAERWFTEAFIKNNPGVMEWRRQKSLKNDPVCYANAYKVLANTDLIDHLHKIKIPVLAITGELDVGSPPRMSKLIAKTVQNGSVIILPDLKHSVLLEAPKRIAREIRNFLNNSLSV